MNPISQVFKVQGHLEQISNFLIPGPGVWWEKGNGTVVFRDGDRDNCFREQGSSLQHFHSSYLTDVQHTAAEVWNELLKVDITLPLYDKDIRVFDTSGNFTGYQSAMNSNVDNMDNVHDCVINCTCICHESNMSMDSSTTQLVSTLKPSIGIPDDDPHNPMDVAVPNDLEGDYVVVGYVDNDAQQPKDCFQNTEVDLKTNSGRILLELLGNSDSIKRFDTARYQLKIKRSHTLHYQCLTRPYMILCLHKFIVKSFQCILFEKRY